METATKSVDELPRPWLDHYPEGVPWDIPTDKYKNAIELLESTFSRYPDSPAVENLGRTLTYRELEEQSEALAAYLQHRGFEPGDTLAIQMPNVIQYVVTLFAAIRAGLRIVNLNPLYTTSEMRGPLKTTRAKGIVILSNFASKLEELLPEQRFDLIIVTHLGDALPLPKRLLVNVVVKHVKKMVPPYTVPGAVSWSNALSAGRQARYKRPDVAPEQTLFLQLTGGTTGVPKAAELSHSNITANVAQCAAAFHMLRPGQEVLLAALPFYHIFGLTVNCLFMVSLGAKLVLITNPRDIPAFVKTMIATRFTVFPALNTLFNALMNHPDFPKIDFGPSKLFVAGGMALQEAVGARWLKMTGKPILEGYGLSETSPVISCNLPATNKAGSIGQPFPKTDVAILDDDGGLVALGERGEVCVKGPQVMRGYFENPEETKNVFTSDGWFRTGDIGILDEEGFISIVDRKKDMILVSGFNVFPNEVEDAVAKHAAVRECAVIGVPDDKSTERVKACVVLKEGASATEEQIIEHCRSHLAGYKVPKIVQFYDDLPKTNVGKILRRELR